MAGQFLLVLTLIPFILSASVHIPPIDQHDMCEWQGHKFAKGTQYKPTDCTTCLCDHGGQPACIIADCFFTPCVDYVHVAGECCNRCPTGNNCYATNGQIIKAGSEVQIDDHTFCTCPSPWLRKNATCHITSQTN